MIPLTVEEKNLHCKQRVCYIKKKHLVLMMTKKYHKVRDHCYYTGKYEVAGGDNCNLK